MTNDITEEVLAVIVEAITQREIALACQLSKASVQRHLARLEVQERIVRGRRASWYTSGGQLNKSVQMFGQVFHYATSECAILKYKRQQDRLRCGRAECIEKRQQPRG